MGELLGVHLIMNVIAPPSPTGAPVFLEQFSQFFKQIGLGAEVAEIDIPRHCRFSHHPAHIHAIIAMKAVSLDRGGLDPLAPKDMLERIFNRTGSRAGRSRDGYNWMFLGHNTNPGILVMLYGGSVL